MLTLLTVILMISVFWKLLSLLIMATWGIAKAIFSFVLYPIFVFAILAFIISGLIQLALPILLLVGIVALILGCFKKSDS